MSLGKNKNSLLPRNGLLNMYLAASVTCKIMFVMVSKYVIEIYSYICLSDFILNYYLTEKDVEVQAHRPSSVGQLS